MSAFTRIFKPLGQLSAAFFTHDVALRRSAAGSVRVVLAERTVPGAAGTTAGASPARAAAQSEQQELALIQTQLAELLDVLPDTRRAMRHLAFVEAALARTGLRVLHKLPPDVLQKALEQIEDMVTNWSPAGLASLRSKMAVAITARRQTDPDGHADAGHTAAALDDDATVAGLRIEAASGAARQPLHGASDAGSLAAAYAALGAEPGMVTSP